MAQYKVPQDVEADDKLLGPFNFRQFVYLLVSGGLIALAVGLFQLFPLLTLLPAPFALFFLALALPLKKDQPMETYLAAIVSFYLKPRKRVWAPGQKDTIIRITAPKIVDDNKSRNITGEEANNRINFLANIVDTEGYAIKNVGRINNELRMEADMTSDIFETYQFDNLEKTISNDENKRHEELIKGMKEAIAKSENVTHEIVGRGHEDEDMDRMGNEFGSGLNKGPDFGSSTVVMPGSPVKSDVVERFERIYEEPSKKVEEKVPKSSIIELANNPDFSVATIAKEANRINRKEDGEVFISLH